MPYATINKPSLHFNTVTWTGDSTTPKTITGVGFQPDLIWGKDRSSPYSHQLFDAVRGFGSEKELTANANLAEGGQNADTYGYLSGVTADGFTTVKGSDAAGYDYWNESPDTYVAWNWKANGAGVANTAGTISSTVSANTTSGFSIVSYTSPNSASDQTVGHGLGVAPSFIITKNLDNSYNWDIHHKSLSSGNGLLFTTDVPRAGVFGSMTSTTFGTKNSYTHASTNRYIAYCFAEIKGYSKFGSYTGNGSTDGTFVYTGFKPAMVIFKTTSTTSDWLMADTKRLPINPMNGSLATNLSNTEGYFGGNNLDFLSNGFKLRNSGNPNLSATYIYMAFAEQPLVGTNNVPCTAR